MNIIIKYTQPKLFPNQVINVREHTVLCSDTETFSNGHPKAIGDDAKWNGIIENIDGESQHEIIL